MKLLKELYVTKDAGHDDTFENVRKAVKKMTDAELIKFAKELPGSKAKEFKAGTPRKELEDYAIEVIHNTSWKTRTAFVKAKLKESVEMETKPLVEEASGLVFVQIVSEDKTYVVQMTQADANKAKQLLQKAQKDGDWPDEVNKIINKSKKVKLAGTINTMGDGRWWYK